MSKSKAEMITEITTMVVEMRPLIAKVFKREEHIYLHPSLVELKSAEIQLALNWVKGIHAGVFAAYQKVRALLPEAMWKRYEAWGGFDDHREVVLLAEATAAFKKALGNGRIPTILKKSHICEQFPIKKVKKDEQA